MLTQNNFPILEIDFLVLF